MLKKGDRVIIKCPKDATYGFRRYNGAIGIFDHYYYKNQCKIDISPSNEEFKNNLVNQGWTLKPSMLCEYVFKINNILETE